MIDANAMIGTFWVGTGAVTVTGAGSLWETLGTLHVGYNGNATMVVSEVNTIGLNSSSMVERMAAFCEPAFR